MYIVNMESAFLRWHMQTVWGRIIFHIQKRISFKNAEKGKFRILFKFRGRLICLKNKLLILQYLFFLKFKFFSFTTEFE